MPFKNIEKRRAYQREYYKKHNKNRYMQRIKEDADYLEKRRAYARAYKKRYTEEHADKIKESNKKYYLKNKTKLNKYSKLYYLEQKAKELKKENNKLKKMLKIEIRYACFYRQVLHANGLLKATHEAMNKEEKQENK